MMNHEFERNTRIGTNAISKEVMENLLNDCNTKCMDINTYVDTLMQSQRELETLITKIYVQYSDKDFTDGNMSTNQHLISEVFKYVNSVRRLWVDQPIIIPVKSFKIGVVLDDQWYKDRVSTIHADSLKEAIQNYINANRDWLRQYEIELVGMVK